MKAELLFRSKDTLSDGAIVEMVIWQVPEPKTGSAHLYKYRLFYGEAGVRVIGFDNERGKGDHRHLNGLESLYRFTDVDQLVDDFLKAVRKWREQK